MASENLDIIIRADGDDASREIGGVQSKMGGLAKFAKAGAASLLVASAGMVAFGKSALDAAAAMETQEIGFKTLLGTSEKAGAFIRDLQKFAANTPFEFTGLAESSQQLLNMGFQAKEVIPMMTRVGDAVAAAGGDPQKLESTVRALTQIKAKGKLSAEEMMQLAEAGTFSWNALATSLGVTVAQAMDMSSKGRISAQQAIDAFMDNSKNRFDGAMQAQSQTFSGLMSTLSDNWNAFLTGQGAKLLVWAKDFTQLLINFISNDLPVIIDKFDSFTKKVAEFLPEGEELKGFFSGLGSTVAETAKKFEAKTHIVAQLKEGFGRLWSQLKEELMPALSELWVAMQPLMPYFEKLGIIVGGALVLAFKLFVEVLVATLQFVTWLLTKIVEIATFTLEHLAPAIEFATGVFSKIGEILMWVVEKFDAVKEAAISASNAVKNAVSSVPGASMLLPNLPGRATGGPVTGGQAYMVGERGPEMFVPGSSGNIVPNHAMGSASEIHIMEGAQISVGSRSDMESLADVVAQRLARVLQSQRNGLATAM